MQQNAPGLSEDVLQTLSQKTPEAIDDLSATLLHVFHQVVCVCRSSYSVVDPFRFALDDDTLLLMYDIVVDNPRELQLVGSSTIGVKDHLVLDKRLAAMDAQSLRVMGPGPGALFAVSFGVKR